MSDDGTAGGGRRSGTRRMSRREQAVLTARLTQDETLGDLVLSRVGGNFVKATHVLGYIACFGVFTVQNGREPSTMLELAESVKGQRSKATLDRYASAFRAAFPEYRTPSALWTMVAPRVVPSENPDALALHLGAVPLG